MPGAVARLTGGDMRGRIVHVPGNAPAGFRPTTGRVREAVFNLLGDLVEDARFLDLYAGAGLMGLEALSRGAREAVFVEANARLAAAIRASCHALGVEDECTCIHGRLPSALDRIAGPFDIVYLDAPYAEPPSDGVYARLAPLLGSGARVVSEHASRYNPPQRPPGLALEQRRIYGDSAIALYRTLESQ